MTINITESQVIKHSSDDDVVLSVQGVSKKFCRSLKRSLFYGVQDIASELVGARKDNNQLRKDEFWALQDISFELKKGESLGLVGANGSGKTTLLRIISGLIKPDRGSVKVTGRVAPLIAAGVGFNPILTGRENIYVNMSILGLSNQEIREKFHAVVDFAEIPEALDAPVKTYSSGMKARLGFACAIYTKPDILLVDEALAVGDIQFRLKCYQRLAELKDDGTIFILVSHAAQSILSVCNVAAYLFKGNLVAVDKPELIITKYEEDLFFTGVEKVSSTIHLAKKVVKESHGLNITYIEFKNNTNEVIQHPITGELINLCIGYKADKFFNELNLKISIGNYKTGETVFSSSSDRDQTSLSTPQGNGEICLVMPCLGMIPGVYGMKVSIYADGELFLLDAVQNFTFKIKAHKSLSNCSFYQQRYWRIEPNKYKNINQY